MEKSKLNLRLLSDGKAILTDDYIYDINGYQIKVFKGFITDGASIPKSITVTYTILMENGLRGLLYTTIYIQNIIPLE